MQELDSGSYFDCYGDKIKNLSDDLRKQDEELYTKESIDFYISGYIDAAFEIMTYHQGFCTEALKETSLEESIKVFLSGNWEGSNVNFICELAIYICETFALSKKVYSSLCFTFAWYVAVGDKELAAEYARPIINYNFNVIRLDQLPKENGRKGGRPNNRHKIEAANLAKEKWRALPAAGLGAVITAVKHQLEKKYKDAPSVSTLKLWLKDADFRPKESRR
ncbi:hypothetical protein WB67_10655 [bacteria symbiont BFo2 of Frankliniella occidentalis]|nr:hypothetical protein WB60_05125 [bacteria symbiont BFo2 of Frankliniella occidentalis]KYP94212.1 hypothetical protein WB67_10655 [bacteria symbiont BFo2 of Frankliniella occidentalis]